MAKKLLLTAICLLALPVFYSTSSERGPKSTAPFQSVAFAGHTLLGGWCECGAPGCICDPGELGGSSRPVPNQTEKPSRQSSPIREHSRSGFDFGSGALMLALALFVWTRLRA